MKILIICNDLLGDSVMILHSIQGILKKYPDCKFDLTINIGNTIKQAVPSIQTTMSLKNIFNIMKKHPLTFREKCGLNKTYDYILSLKTSSYKAKYLICSASKNQVSLWKTQEDSGIHFAQGIIDHIDWTDQDIDIKAERYILPKKALSYKLPYTSNYNKEYNLAICPDSSTFTRNWGAQNFYEIAKKLSEKYNIFLFSGPNQINDCAYIEQNLVKDNIPCVNLQGKTSRDEFIAAMSKMDLAITNDSGPMHVAGLVDIPVISIMGPDSPKRIGPFMHDKFYPVHKNICPPCVQTDICKKIRRKKDKAFPCINAVKIEDVIQVIYDNNFL